MIQLKKILIKMEQANKINKEGQSLIGLTQSKNRVIIWFIFSPTSEQILIKDMKEDLPNETIHVFLSEYEILMFLKDADKNGIIDIYLITSGKLAKRIEEIIQTNPLMSYVFIYCFQEENHKAWTSKHSNIICCSSDYSVVKNKLMEKLSKNDIETQIMTEDLSLKSGYYFDNSSHV